MQIISCCTVLCIVLLAVLCTDEGENKIKDENIVNENKSEDPITANAKLTDSGNKGTESKNPTVNNTPEVTTVSAACALTSPNFTYPDKPVMHVPFLGEGEKVNLTCSAPFPCPEAPPKITWWIWTGKQNITDLKDNINLTISKNLLTSTLTPTADLYNATVGCVVSYRSKTISTNRTLKDMYLRILGNGKVMEGGTLNLSCTVESHPSSSVPVWGFPGINGTTDRVMNQTSAEFLTINNVTKKNAGVYTCLRTYENKTLNASITINVIPNTNGSENISPNIGSTQGIKDFFLKWDISKILTFVAGMACSALIFSMVLCCWVSCHRSKKKHKVPTENPDTDVNLEMVQTDVAQTGTNEETPLHGQPNGVNPNTAGPTDGAEEEGAVGMDVKEVDYASIDYSLLKDRAPEEEEKEPTDTDYAEIKRDKRGNGNEGEVLSDGDDQAETTDQIEGEELELELKS